MDVELRHLRYFVAVAEELHFGRAAKRLHLAQPPLSQQIRKLEEIVGFPLFTRTSRAVQLTTTGELFLARAKRTLRLVEEDLEEARGIGRGESGTLRVGFISSCMLTRIPGLLREYHRTHPRVQLQLHEAYTARVVDQLLRHEVDAGILRDGGPREGLAVRTIAAERFLAVVPRQHPLAGRTSIDPKALRHDRFVMFPKEAGDLAYSRTLAVFAEAGFEPRVVQEGPQWLTILRLVAAGLGVTIAPECVRQIASPDVVCLELKGTKARSEVEIAWRHGEERPLVHAFASACLSGTAPGKLKPY
jgi:DNA-binding transcriptional LysR family regulator